MGKYHDDYENFEVILKPKLGETIPTDIYKQVAQKNMQLYHNLDFWQFNLKRKIEKQFNSIDEAKDADYIGLKSFVRDVAIKLEKDLV